MRRNSVLEELSSNSERYLLKRQKSIVKLSDAGVENGWCVISIKVMVL